MRVPVPDTLLPADQLGTVHFVGIGGAGLSGIARIMLARGITVSSSDAKESRTIEALRALGAVCHVGHDAANVGDADTLVVSTAVRETNPEVVEATALGVEDEEWGHRLRAFVVKTEGAGVDEDAIKAYVKENLARYKVPREVEFIDELPRNATGKVLKRELKEQHEEKEGAAA